MFSYFEQVGAKGPPFARCDLIPCEGLGRYRKHSRRAAQSRGERLGEGRGGRVGLWRVMLVVGMISGLAMGMGM